jgi:hypothetical protein
MEAAMTDRDALIEAGTQAVCDWDPDYDPADADTRAAVGVVIDAVMTNLRAQVQTLPTENRYTEGPRFVDLDKVLALLDGGSDE